MKYQDLLPGDRLEVDFGELKPAFTEGGAIAEASRCLYCHDAPCIPACPTHIDIPEFIRKIATGNYAGSARTIFESNILGMSCARVCPVEVLCEGACVFNAKKEPPIKIGRLQRFSTDWAYEKEKRFFERGPSTGKRIAIVGAGPAGLACAHELAVLGHEAVIFDRDEMPGGLNTTGVAAYKMNSDAALREVDYVLEIGGIDLNLGVEVGEDITWDELEESYDAIFLGIGLGPDGRLNLEGADQEGVVGACALIERFKTEERFDFDSEAAVVVGGGNTAIDAVRQLKKAGVPRVIMVYRRTEAEMPAYDHETEWAKKEGGLFQFRANPTRILGNGRVEGVECERMKPGEPDDSGRRRPVGTGETFTIDCDLVVEAIGQAKLVSVLEGIDDLELTWGRIKVDPETGRTSNPHYFAGGDAANGGKEVVNAVAEAKRAAHGIHEYVMNEG